MQPVEIFHNQGTIVLRARSSELLILPFHVKELQGLKKPQSFADYFKNQALVNRPARKLFEAWLKKDGTLWPRLFKTVQEEMETVEIDESTIESTPKPQKEGSKKESTTKQSPVKKPIKDKASTKLTEDKASTKLTEDKPEEKASKKTAKKAAKKTAKKTAKKAAKKTTKKAAKKTTKKAAKKTTKKAAKKTTKKAAKKTTKNKK